MKDIEDEIPFAVPEGWAWCRLGEVCEIISGTSYQKNDIISNGALRILRGGNIQNNDLILRSDDVFIHDKYIDSRKNITVGDIIIVASTGSTNVIGKPAFIDKDYATTQIGAFLRIIRMLFFPISKYISFIFQSEYYVNYIQNNIKGTNINNIKGDHLQKMLLPIPSLSEQQRIVNIIEAIFAQIDLLEQNRTDLQTAIKQAKSKILDLAIHGKLVPQDPNDEPASVMLEKLRTEKEAKIAAGKMKRDKNDSYIYKNAADNCYYEKFDGKSDVCIDNEIPFELPANWQWTKLGRICDKLVDGDHNPPKGIEEKTEYIMVSSRNINHNTVEDLENVRYLTKEMFEAENLRTNVAAGDILFTSVGSLGRSCIYDGRMNICFQRSVSILNTKVYNKYVKIFFDSNFYQNYVAEHATGTAQMGFYLQEMAESFIAIPPISEQKRIVTKVEEIFNALDDIQSNLVSNWLKSSSILSKIRCCAANGGNGNKIC